MLEVALITAHAAHLSLPGEIEAVFDMITINGAKILGFNDYALAPGRQADVVILNCTSVQEAIRLRPDRLYVVKEGRVIATNCTKRRLNRKN